MPRYPKASTTKGLEYPSRSTVCVKRIKNKEDYIDLLLDADPSKTLLYLYPELVDMNVAKDFDISMDIFMPYSEHKVDEPIDGYIGNVGYSTLATREKGKVIYERMMIKLENVIKSKLKI